MSDAPENRDKHHTGHQDSHRDGTGAQESLPDDRRPSHPDGMLTPQEARRESGDHAPSQSVPSHHFDPTGPEERHDSQTPHYSLQAQVKSEDPQSQDGSVHPGSDQYSNYHTEDRSFSSLPGMDGYHGLQDNQRQRNWPEHTGGMIDHPDRSHTTGAHIEPGSPTFQPRDIQQSPYTQAPLTSADGYAFSESNTGHAVGNEPSGAHYPHGNVGLPFHYSTLRRSVSQEMEPSQDRLYPDSTLERGYFPDVSGSLMSQDSWDFPPGPPHPHQMQDASTGGAPPRYMHDAYTRATPPQMQDPYTSAPSPHQRTHDNLGGLLGTSTNEVEDATIQRSHDSASGGHHVNNSTYNEPHGYARDHVSPQDEDMIGTSRHIPPGLQLLYAEKDREYKTKAWDFAMEAYQEHQIDALVNCGNPYLEQAARKLLEQVEAETASKESTPQFRSNTDSRPVLPHTGGPFEESDVEKEEASSEYESARRQPRQEQEPAVDTYASEAVNSPVAVAQSKSLRGQAQQNSPQRSRTAVSDADLASLFEQSDLTFNSASSFAQQGVTPKLTADTPASLASGRHANGFGQVLKQASDHKNGPSPMNVDSDPYPQLASASQAPSASDSKVNPAEMARIMAERNRQKELSWSSTPHTLQKSQSVSQAAVAPAPKFDMAEMARTLAERNRQKQISSMAPPPKPGAMPQPTTSQPVKAPVARTGDSQDRAISISSAEDESDDTSSYLSSDIEEVKNGKKADDGPSGRGLGLAGSPSTRTLHQQAAVPSNMSGTAPGQQSGWQAALAVMQKLPAAPEVERPAAVGTGVSSSQVPLKDHDHRKAQHKTQEQSTNLNRAEPRTNAGKQSVDDAVVDMMAYRAERDRLAKQMRDEEEEKARRAASEPESEAGDQRDQRRPYTESQPSTTSPRKAPSQKPKKAVAQGGPKLVAHARQLPIKSTAAEDVNAAGDERVNASAAARPHEPCGSSNQPAQQRKRTAPEAASSRAKRSKASGEWEQTMDLPSIVQQNKHGLPPLQSPIPSSDLQTYISGFGGDVEAFREAAPTCAKVLSEESGSLAPTPTTTGKSRAPSKKPLPASIASETGTASPRVQIGLGTTTRRRPFPMCDADKKMIKWRRQGVAWDIIHIRWNKETGHGYSVSTLIERHKRALQLFPELSATTIAVPDTSRAVQPTSRAVSPTSRTVPPPDALVPQQTPEEQQAEKPKPSLGGKTWSADALEALRANQREIDAFLTDDEGADKDKDIDEESSNIASDKHTAPRGDHDSRMPSPEPLDENECWYQYRVLRTVWKEFAQTRTADPEPMDADSNSGSDSSDDEEDKITKEVLVPETVVGPSSYHTLLQANAAARKEMRGRRFGSSGIGHPGASGCREFKYEAGPYGMIKQEARFADDVVVRVWVDRFVRAPGMARQDESQLEDGHRPDVRSAPHGWLSKQLWVIKRKEVEVRVVAQDGDGDAMETEEVKLVGVQDLGIYTVLDEANRDAAKMALEYVHPASNRRIDAIQARVSCQKQLQQGAKDSTERNEPFEVSYEGQPVVLTGDGQGDGVSQTRRVDAKFWVEGSVLKGPRNI